jgi:mevalonate kinase
MSLFLIIFDPFSTNQSDKQQKYKMVKAKLVHVSAPGKVIISGEHAVVYGKKALACSIDLRTNCILSQTTDPIFRIVFEDLNKTIEIDQDMFSQTKHIYKTKCNASTDEFIVYLESDSNRDDQMNSVKLSIAIIDQLTWPCVDNYELVLKTELPIGAGLGSSASYSTCLATVFLHMANLIDLSLSGSLDPYLDAINKQTYNTERLFHARPSGIDNTVVTYGNYVLFQNGTIVDRFKSSQHVQVLIVNSNLEKKTREQVQKVKALNDTYPDLIESIMTSIGLVCDQVVDCLKTDLSTGQTDSKLKQLIRINQSLLGALLVSNVKLDSIVNLAGKFNIPCKITGAGGGGCCLALISSGTNGDDNTDLVCFQKELKRLDVDSFFCTVGCDGIRVEKISF